MVRRADHQLVDKRVSAEAASKHLQRSQAFVEPANHQLEGWVSLHVGRRQKHGTAHCFGHAPGIPSCAWHLWLTHAGSLLQPCHGKS